MKRKTPSRLRAAIDRLGERLGQSSSAFLAVLIVLCAIEVMVDWNSTLFEINVLRGQLRLKGENYADLLRKAGEGALFSYDWESLDRLSAGLFDDEEVLYVRWADVLGNVIYDRVRPEMKDPGAFRERYRRQMQRDVSGMLSDARKLKGKMESSRHKDFIQRFTDFEDGLIARFAGPAPPPPEQPPRALYQDRLTDDKGGLDRDLSWSLGSIVAPGGDTFGVVLVAFSHDKLNAGTRKKLWKGLAITIFFVALILVQNLLSRRGKLRLAALEKALAAARAAIRDSLPEIAAPGLDLGVGLAQSDGVGGLVYDLREDGAARELFVVSPEGSGVGAAFASMAVRDLWRQLARDGRLGSDPVESAATLLQAFDGSPLARPVSLVILRVEGKEARGVVAGFGAPWRLQGDVSAPIALGTPITPGPPRLRGPLAPFACALEGNVLAFFDDGDADPRLRRLPRDEAFRLLAKHLARENAGDAAQAVSDEAARRARKRHADDVLCVAVRLGGRP